jgi:hypothetical protein
MEVALCFLIAAFFTTETMSGFRTNLLKRIVIYLLVTLFAASSVTLINSRPLPEGFTANVMNPERIKDVMDPAIEYTPIWAGNMKQIMSEEKPVKITVMSGPALTDILEWKPEKRSISIVGSAPSLLRVATFYYPGWQAKINDRVIPIGKEDMSGAMLIQVPEGKQTLELCFVDTPTRYYSGAVSLFSCLILVLLVVFQAIKKVARHDSINRKNGCLKGV